MHFGSVLLLAAIVSAPWHALTSAALAIGVLGLAGIGYSALIIRRARLQTGYTPVFEDWLWHIVLPLVSHVVLVGSALALFRGATDALFGVATVSLLLLFVGIHNAWDSVVFLALQRPSPARES